MSARVCQSAKLVEHRFLIAFKELPIESRVGMTKTWQKTIYALLVGLIVHAAVVSSLAMVWCPGSGTVHSEHVPNPSEYASVAKTYTQLSQVIASDPDGKLGVSCGSHHRAMGDAIGSSLPDEAAIAPVCSIRPPDELSADGALRPPQQLGASPFLRELRTVVLLI